MHQGSIDVLVAGAGTAGVCAALQAARAGASCLLVERAGMPGGTTTLGGVDFPGLFHAWGKQVIAGIGWDLVRRCVAESGGTLPDFAVPPRAHWQHQIRINAPLFACLCDEALQQSGVSVLYHAMPAAVHRDGAGWRVTLCTKQGLEEVPAKVLVDATGDANLAELAGCPRTVVADPQPATLVCRASGYDLRDLDLDAIDAAFRAKVQAGALSPTAAGWDASRPSARKWLQQHGSNANHLHLGNASTSWSRSRLEQEARTSLLALVRFLRSQPGLGNLTLDWLAPECGVRETATIQGRTIITAQDYVSGRVFPDAVCHAFYPVDLHTAGGAGLDCRQLAPGVVPTVPRGALLPRGHEGIAVAGRCLASDRLANSALRVQATGMATGQAVGAMAALSGRLGCGLGDVPLAALRALLAEHGAILPPTVAQ